MKNHGTPTVICCSRSTVDALELASREKASKGAYAVVECESPKVVLVATGSEVGPCVEAAKKIGDGVRVVSMPCQEVFLQQSQEYQQSVLPGNVPTLSVEASACHGWHRFSHAQISMTTFGRSGNGSDVFEFFGFSADNIAKQATGLMAFYEGKAVPNLGDVFVVTPPNDPHTH